MGSFISGFMGTIAKNLKAKHDREDDEARRDRDTQIDVFSKIIGNPNYSPEQQQWAAGQLDEIIGKGKGRGGGRKAPIVKLSDLVAKMLGHKPKGEDQQQGQPQAGQQQPMSERTPQGGTPVNPATGGQPMTSSPADRSLVDYGSPEARARANASPVSPVPVPNPEPGSPVAPMPAQPGAGIQSGRTAQPSFSQMVVPMSPEEQAARNRRIATEDEDAKYATAMDRAKQMYGGNVPEDVQRDIFESVYGIRHSAAGAPHFAKTQTSGDDILEMDPNAKDIHDNPVQKGKIYDEVWDNTGFRGYQPAARKVTALEQRIQEKVKDYQAAHPGVSYEVAERTVRAREEFKERQAIILQGARIHGQQLSAEHVQRIIQKIDSGEGYTPTIAHWILSGAEAQAAKRQAAVLRKEDPDYGKTLDQLTDEEIALSGTTRLELNLAMRNSRKAAPAGAKLPPGWK
jgi:hypothetical protein